MTLAWMAYLVIVSALAAGAALAAERALRLYRRPARWAWAAALLVSAGLPALASRPRRGSAAGPDGASAPEATKTSLGVSYRTIGTGKREAGKGCGANLGIRRLSA